MATEALLLEGVNACYGDSHVLHDVSFAMPAGRVLALLGRNGAGKTTCMLSVMGLLWPRSGRIALFGRALTGLPPEAIAAAGIGYVPQGRRVFASLTVHENLAVARALMGNPRVLLMDEPSEGLAPLIVAEVGRTIAWLKAEGQCIVLVEQNLRLALELADDCVILNTGRVVYTGTAQALGADERVITQQLGVF